MITATPSPASTDTGQQKRDRHYITPLESIVHDADNASLMPLIPGNTRRLLDIDCVTGLSGARVKAEIKACEVVGITISDAEAQAAADRLDTVLVRDLIREGLSDLGLFDCVVCSHALGYFHDQFRILSEIRGVLAPGGIF